MFKIGDLVKISEYSDNENYDEFRDQTLVIIKISTSEYDHPGFDAGMAGQGLYDLETLDGEEVPFSLYDYELEEV